MTQKAHLHPTDLRGFSRLAIDATIGLTRLVENMHHNISRTPGPVGRHSKAPTTGITGMVRHDWSAAASTPCWAS